MWSGIWGITVNQRMKFIKLPVCQRFTTWMIALTFVSTIWSVAYPSPLVTPTISIDNGIVLKNCKPTYLIGFSPSALFYDGSRDIKKMRSLPEEINYMRTWLEAWDAPGVQSPFVLVNGKADLKQLNPQWLASLGDFLDASASAGVVQELTLFNPWAAREHWESHWWNPNNNIQGFDVNADSLYTLNNSAQTLQELWVEQILDVVENSNARDYVIIEIDNELLTGGASWRDRFITQVKAHGNYIVSAIATYADDFDPIESNNDIIALHGGGSGNPADYIGRTLAFEKTKPVIFNELYPWYQHSRESQRAVFWSIFLAGGMFAVDYWGGGETNQAETLDDIVALARFVEQIDFINYQPHVGWLSTTGETPIAKAHRNGTGFITYLDNAQIQQPITVTLPRGTYSLKWINPATGTGTHTRTLTSSGADIKLTPPEEINDAVLFIQSISTR